MKLLLLLLMIKTAFSAPDAQYHVLKGKLHTKGSVVIHILPDTEVFKVQMAYDVKKKSLVPVPSKLLKGKTVINFPPSFRTEAGYK